MPPNFLLSLIFLFRFAAQIVNKGDPRFGKKIFSSLYSLGYAFVRKAIQRRAGFNLANVDPLAVMNRCEEIPTLFLHANGDNFVGKHHTDLLYQAHTGPSKELFTFEGDHNSFRPLDVYDRVSTFLHKYALRSHQRSGRFYRPLHMAVTGEEEKCREGEGYFEIAASLDGKGGKSPERVKAGGRKSRYLCARLNSGKTPKQCRPNEANVILWLDEDGAVMTRPYTSTVIRKLEATSIVDCTYITSKEKLVIVEKMGGSVCKQPSGMDKEVVVPELETISAEQEEKRSSKATKKKKKMKGKKNKKEKKEKEREKERDEDRDEGLSLTYSSENHNFLHFRTVDGRAIQAEINDAVAFASTKMSMQTGDLWMEGDDSAKGDDNLDTTKTSEREIDSDSTPEKSGENEDGLGNEEKKEERPSEEQEVRTSEEQVKVLSSMDEDEMAAAKEMQTKQGMQVETKSVLGEMLRKISSVERSSSVEDGHELKKQEEKVEEQSSQSDLEYAREEWYTRKLQETMMMGEDLDDEATITEEGRESDEVVGGMDILTMFGINSGKSNDNNHSNFNHRENLTPGRERKHALSNIVRYRSSSYALADEDGKAGGVGGGRSVGPISFGVGETGGSSPLRAGRGRDAHSSPRQTPISPRSSSMMRISSPKHMSTSSGGASGMLTPMPKTRCVHNCRA